jgi:hypothetical protein
MACSLPTNGSTGRAKPAKVFRDGLCSKSASANGGAGLNQAETTASRSAPSSSKAATNSSSVRRRGQERPRSMRLRVSTVTPLWTLAASCS